MPMPLRKLPTFKVRKTPETLSLDIRIKRISDLIKSGKVKKTKTLDTFKRVLLKLLKERQKRLEFQRQIQINKRKNDLTQDLEKDKRLVETLRPKTRMDKIRRFFQPTFGADQALAEGRIKSATLEKSRLEYERLKHNRVERDLLIKKNYIEKAVSRFKPEDQEIVREILNKELEQPFEGAYVPIAINPQRVFGSKPEIDLEKPKGGFYNRVNAWLEVLRWHTIPTAYDARRELATISLEEARKTTQRNFDANWKAKAHEQRVANNRNAEDRKKMKDSSLSEKKILQILKDVEKIKWKKWKTPFEELAQLKQAVFYTKNIYDATRNPEHKEIYLELVDRAIKLTERILREREATLLFEKKERAVLDLRYTLFELTLGKSDYNGAIKIFSKYTKGITDNNLRSAELNILRSRLMTRIRELERIKDYKNIAIIKRGLANSYDHLGQDFILTMSDAASYFAKAHSYYDAGNCYKDAHQYDLAAKMYELANASYSAKEMYKKVDDYDGAARVQVDSRELDAAENTYRFAKDEAFEKRDPEKTYEYGMAEINIRLKKLGNDSPEIIQQTKKAMYKNLIDKLDHIADELRKSQSSFFYESPNKALSCYKKSITLFLELEDQLAVGMAVYIRNVVESHLRTYNNRDQPELKKFVEEIETQLFEAQQKSNNIEFKANVLGYLLESADRDSPIRTMLSQECVRFSLSAKTPELKERLLTRAYMNNKELTSLEILKAFEALESLGKRQEAFDFLSKCFDVAERFYDYSENPIFGKLIELQVADGKLKEVIDTIKKSITNSEDVKLLNKAGEILIKIIDEQYARKDYEELIQTIYQHADLFGHLNETNLKKVMDIFVQLDAEKRLSVSDVRRIYVYSELLKNSTLPKDKAMELIMHILKNQPSGTRMDNIVNEIFDNIAKFNFSKKERSDILLTRIKLLAERENSDLHAELTELRTNLFKDKLVSEEYLIDELEKLSDPEINPDRKLRYLTAILSIAQFNPFTDSLNVLKLIEFKKQTEALLKDRKPSQQVGNLYYTMGQLSTKEEKIKNLRLAWANYQEAEYFYKQRELIFKTQLELLDLLKSENESEIERVKNKPERMVIANEALKESPLNIDVLKKVSDLPEYAFKYFIATIMKKKFDPEFERNFEKLTGLKKEKRAHIRDVLSYIPSSLIKSLNLIEVLERNPEVFVYFTLRRIIPTKELINLYAKDKEAIQRRVDRKSSFDPSNETHLIIEYGKYLSALRSISKNLDSPEMYMDFDKFKEDLIRKKEHPQDLDKTEMSYLSYEIQRSAQQIDSVIDEYGDIGIIGNMRTGHYYGELILSKLRDPKKVYYTPKRIGSTELHGTEYILKSDLMDLTLVKRSLLRGQPLFVVDATPSSNKVPDAFKGYISWAAGYNILVLKQRKYTKPEIIEKVAELTKYPKEVIERMYTDVTNPENHFYKDLIRQVRLAGRRMNLIRINIMDMDGVGRFRIKRQHAHEFGNMSEKMENEITAGPGEIPMILLQPSISDANIPATVRDKIGKGGHQKGWLDDQDTVLHLSFRLGPDGIEPTNSIIETLKSEIANSIIN